MASCRPINAGSAASGTNVLCLTGAIMWSRFTPSFFSFARRAGFRRSGIRSLFIAQSKIEWISETTLSRCVGRSASGLTASAICFDLISPSRSWSAISCELKSLI